MEADMKNVTTLADKKRMEELLAAYDSDDDSKAYLAKQPVAAAAIEKAPIVYHFFVFMQRCVALSCDKAVVQHLVDQHADEELAHCLQLQLFSPASTDHIFKLCFHENEQLSNHAVYYVRDHLCSGEQWLCSHALALEVISSLGTSNLLGMSWKEMVKCTVESTMEETGEQRLYVCNQALHRVRILLELICLSYSTATGRLTPPCQQANHEDILRLLELLLLLNCDFTIQKHFPHLAGAAFTSVLAYCRRIEIQGLALAQVTCTGVGLSSLQLTEQQQREPGSGSTHNDADEVEDSILSQDMQEKATISPTTPISSNLPDASSAAFPYTPERLADLPEHSMSRMLWRTLRGVVEREVVSLHMLTSMCGLLAQHPDYHTLWTAFTASVFTLRVAPYFPTVAWSSLTTGGSSAGAAASRVDGGATAASVPITDAAFVALIVESVKTLRTQYDALFAVNDSTFSSSRDFKVSMWNEVGNVVALFRLIHRYILVLGDQLESALLEALEDVCQKFKKTKCGESLVLDTIDMIKATCELFLDCC